MQLKIQSEEVASAQTMQHIHFKAFTFEAFDEKVKRKGYHMPAWLVSLLVFVARLQQADSK